MYKKVAYLLIVFLSGFIIFNYLNAQSKFDAKKADLSADLLIDRQTTEPRRLFLRTWRIIKSKYYDPTMNGQDWMRWNRRYVDKIMTTDDASVAINSMLASLDDPYSRFLDKKEYSEQTTNIDAKIVGIGVNIISTSGKVLIVSVVEDTPAFEEGIKAGDLILKVDGKNVAGKSVSDVAALIRGKEGESVSLELMRENKKLTKNILREEIQIKNIKTSIIEDKIGYIQISSFISSDLTSEFIAALNKTEKCPGLIIDLRGNAGGLMPNAVFIADMFLPSGHIVSIVDRNHQQSVIDAQVKPYAINKPLVILIDEASASASEILSGALKDNKKAILIGKRTYGKGMIQKIYPLPNETGMNLTIAKYLTPKGYDINKKGIEPDYEVEFTESDYLNNKDPQLDKAKAVMKGMLKTKYELAKNNRLNLVN